MPNYKVTLEYNGAAFFGSQKQSSDSNLRTVQTEVEKSLSGFFQAAIETNFAGRTDVGVHAIGQVLNFQLDSSLDLVETNPGKLLLSLNSQLPEDIVFTKIENVPDEFHARFDAKAREYLYKIFIRRQRPVLRLDSLMWCKEPLDFEPMAAKAQSLIGTHDFSAYAKENPEDNSICTVLESELIKESNICYKYRIKANRFLRHMVRRIVGDLICVGKGQDNNENLSAPAQGLTLMKVYY